jgi:hypothetical protein
MATRYLLRETCPKRGNSPYELTIANPDKALPVEIQGWLQAGEMQLLALEPDGSERLVVG